MIGESLKAAGLTRRRDDTDDVFAEPSKQVSRNLRLNSEDADNQLSLINGRRAESRFYGRSTGRPGSSDGISFAPHTPANQHSSQRAQLSLASRPSTSMASYHHEEPQTAPPFLRTHKSAYPIANRDRQLLPAADTVPRPPSQTRIYSAQTHDRSSSSPSALARRTPLNAAASAAANSNTEHIQLLLDSLNMFESQLARLPSMGSTTTLTIPELFRSAQSIVHQSNALNALLRNGTAHALEAQIDADVEASIADEARSLDSVALWKDVGAEFRECQRVSDEVIRTTTSFLLGVGKVLRDSSTERSHNRTSSLDESVSTARRLTPELSLGVERASASGGRSSDGHSSIDLKQRWVSSSGEMSIGSGKSLPSLQGSNSSQLSSLSSSSRPSTSFRARFESDPVLQNEESSQSNSRVLRLTQSNRRLGTPQEALEVLEERRNDHSSVNARFQGVAEVIPSSATGSSSTLGRRALDLPRRMHTISIPPPLPTLPSESLLSRSNSTASKNTARKQKMSTASNATVRANSIFPSLSTSSNPTTALTTTAVSASPERPSAKTRGTGTLSRITGAAIADLQQHIQRDVTRPRTISDSSAATIDNRHIMSGSETERDWRTTADRPRMSLDSNPGFTRSTTVGRNRRGTVTGLFSRN